jgi:hypothetical protein
LTILGHGPYSPRFLSKDIVILGPIIANGAHFACELPYLILLQVAPVIMEGRK